MNKKEGGEGGKGKERGEEEEGRDGREEKGGRRRRYRVGEEGGVGNQHSPSQSCGTPGHFPILRHEYFMKKRIEFLDRKRRGRGEDRG